MNLTMNFEQHFKGRCIKTVYFGTPKLPFFSSAEKILSTVKAFSERGTRRWHCMISVSGFCLHDVCDSFRFNCNATELSVARLFQKPIKDLKSMFLSLHGCSLYNSMS